MSRSSSETPETLPASGQERAVIQILVNLIGNAVRHSPEDGTVRLSSPTRRRRLR